MHSKQPEESSELGRLRKAVSAKEGILAALRNTSNKGRRKKLRIDVPSPYRSWFEVDIAIDALVRGIPFEYEANHIVWIEPIKVRKYHPDYFIQTKSGNLLLVEAKGRWTAEDRKKICFVSEQNPNLDLRMLFERDNTLSKSPNSKHYSTWCESKGIKYAVGRSIPQEWVDE